MQALTSANVGDQVANAPLLEELGEETGPVRLHSHTSSLDESGDVVALSTSEEAMISAKTFPAGFYILDIIDGIIRSSVYSCEATSHKARWTNVCPLEHPTITLHCF